MKRKIAIIITLAVLTGLSASAVYSRRSAVEPAIATDSVTRGSIVSNVSASGTLQAVTTVQVGTQVSGTVQSLYADFNAIVKKGQILARLEPSLFQSAVEQSRANLLRAEADEQRLKVGLANAEVQLERARQLSARQLIPQTDLDAASVNRDSFAAQVKSAAAAVTQARASLGQAEVNLSKTVIASPIDGIVIARNVDVGQTVAASLQAPTLFVIAADLTRMQLNASIDESDVGQIQPGQQVGFTVDAYPDKRFTGTVAQVRLDPTVASNVVTYAAIINAPNPSLELKPGMTANVTVEIARRDQVLRVANAALRFHPTSEALEALGVGKSAATVPGAKAQTVWVQADGTIRPVAVRVGASDGVNTEILDGVPEGATVVTRVTLAGAASTATKATTSPLMPSGPPRR
ncbi:MAG TPA: efflux RND transporter periplasmic adaptor subunit [Casimicrobiaceae bacterium]